jgi:hypothetical protein
MVLRVEGWQRATAAETAQDEGAGLGCSSRGSKVILERDLGGHCWSTLIFIG